MVDELELIRRKKLEELRKKMEFYSQELRFEEALEFRDRIERITKSSIKNDIDFASKENYDIFVVENNNKKAVIIKIFMREGKIISSSNDIINIKENFDKQELLHRAIINFYSYKTMPITAEILTNIQPQEKRCLKIF